MKRSAKALTFAAAAMAAGMTVSGCWGFGGNVYGPPPSKNTGVTSEATDPSKTTGKETEVTTLPSEYDPTTEPEVDVYGPPPDSPD